MNNPPPLELLRAEHDFPGEFVFKAIGHADDGFVARVVASIREELDLETDPKFSQQRTGPKYVSVTVEPWVQTPEQVLAVFSKLSQTDGVIMLL